MNWNVNYSSLRPFLCHITNQFAQKIKFLANLIKYFISIGNIYLVKSLSISTKWSMRPF